MGDWVKTAEAVEADALPRVHEVHADPATPNAGNNAVPNGVAKTPVQKKSQAQWAYERLIIYLKNFEEQLKKMESNLGDAKALPRHTPQSTAKPEVESRESAPAETPKAEVPRSEPSIARQDDTPPPGPSEDAFKPDTWKGPPKKSRKGNRGPLRIGGRPSSG